MQKYASKNKTPAITAKIKFINIAIRRPIKLDNGPPIILPKTAPNGNSATIIALKTDA